MLNLKADLNPYFRELSETQLERILEITKEYNCKNGDLVYLQGEFCQNLIIVNSGSFLYRKKDQDVVIEEGVLLEGQFYDFESILVNSVTSCSLEAISEASLLVIDILGLKRLSRKKPIIPSLIKLQLPEKEAEIWTDTVLKREKVKKELHYKISRSFLWVLKKVLPYAVAIGLLILLSSFFIKDPSFKKVYTIYFICCLLGTALYYLNSKLIFIELDRTIVSKKSFNIFNVTKEHISIPIEKIEAVRSIYTSRLSRILNIGDISIDSPVEKLYLKGVYNPNKIVDDLNKYRNHRVNIDKAIDLSSFKYLLCKQNSKFIIENQIERDEHQIFAFRKSIIFFLIRSIPSLFVFISSTMFLYLLFEKAVILYLNLPVLFVVLWNFIDWSNDKYAFEGDKIIDIEKKPFLGKEKRIEADIKSIQSIKKEQKNIFQVLFNYGDIEISTISGKITYPSITNPDRVIDNLYLIKQYYYSKEESKNKLLRQEEFLNYTKYYQELNK
ncbi:hypothetical protein EW093_08985 [Thiospirochaeta perfilievii]|uniref:Cyclic nucleotide-binding domain-containing protein n=1 Tax=Thiospirochaeta perfilievii TaxID=252967 RepID=A0A5C1QBD2_9SPIO|nr:hypothetical protein [Thiospirochaeta perfilievii]QEN04831.1 hypothetical protein EW093_08985 [Thiospirochaeta perfilievii]